MKSLPPLPGARRRRTSIKSLFGALTLALCAGFMPIHAADVYEGFDYTAGTSLNSTNAAFPSAYATNAPSGQNGGTGWANGWGSGAGTAGARNTVAGSLSYTGITSAGNKAEIEGSRIFRRFATDLTEGNTYYVSVLLQKDSANTAYMGLMLANAEDNAEKLLIGTSTGYAHWMLGGNAASGAGVRVPEEHSLYNETHPFALSSTAPNTDLALLLVKLELRPVSESNPDGLEQITFWVNPDLSQPEDVTTAIGGQSFPSFSDYGAIRWVRAGGGASTKHYMDEIRISQSPPFPHGRIAVEQPAGTALENGVSSKSFGTRGVDKPHTLTYTLRNTGTGTLSGLAVAVSGANAADFVAGALGATTLAPDATTTFDVTFTPSAIGARTSTLTISSDDPIHGSFVVTQTGQGAGSGIVVEQPVSLPLAPGTSKDFGSSPVGTASPLTFTVSNNGLADLTITGVDITGTNASDFVAGTPEDSTIAPGESTTFDVTFTPSAPGARSASLSIASNAPGSPFTLSLTGTAIKAAQTITFAPPGDHFITEVLALAATGGSSGQTVAFTVVSGPATIVGGELRFTGSGRVILAANQAGDDNHDAAPPVEHSFNVILPRPDVAVGAKPNALKGVRSYAPTKQLADLKSSKARRVTGHIGVGNHAVLSGGRAADRILVQGKKGNAFFKVKYNGPGGNVTAAVVAVGYQTTAIDGNSGMTKLQAVVTPNKKKLAKRQGTSTVYAKKTFSTLMRATSTAYRPASDSATIRVRTR